MCSSDLALVQVDMELLVALWVGQIPSGFTGKLLGLGGLLFMHADSVEHGPDISSVMFMLVNVFVRAIDFLLVVQVEHLLTVTFALQAE